MSPADFVPDHSRPAYIWQQVADHVQKRIEDGDLAPGARLQNERVMAEEYGVATGTVRRAIQELRDRGLVITLPGKGTFVVER
ncbi:MULTISPECIES: winged helix-turn-helix domain-containing protein [Amycolatopsis]|uniref:winged helix-turn-helix domain-containing protein n=1 Tax=Amycolatopsis TaxID=1813 RepID=UPI001E519136|nr:MULTISPECIES: winged helix-turn-helix domain-containing protein [Amycolatopsis]